MTQRAFLYTVTVKRKWHQEYRRLGDVDEHGTRLIDLLDGYITNLSLESEDGTKTATAVAVQWAQGEGDEEEELYASLRHGERDVAAEIIDEQGVEQYKQRRTDEARLHCGALFVLPVDQDRGWLALHTNNGRGVKGLLGPELVRRFAQDFDDLMLELKPYVDLAALRQAVEDGHVEDVRLTKIVKPGDQADAATNRWVPQGEIGKIEVKVQPRGRGKFLRSVPVQRLINGTSQEKATAAQEIVQFEGVAFDEARVTVALPNGNARTFYVQRDGPAGHPWAIDIDHWLDYDNDDNPTDASLRDALRNALDPVL